MLRMGTPAKHCKGKKEGFSIMSMTDPVADMLTRIRNALKAKQASYKIKRLGAAAK